MERDTHFVTGVYEDEDVLLQAITKIRSSGIKIHEVYSPYPVHGIDDYLGYKRSRLPIAAFLFGLLGTTLALTMQYYMMAFDWPMIIGGKDHGAFPGFHSGHFRIDSFAGIIRNGRCIHGEHKLETMGTA